MPAYHAEFRCIAGCSGAHPLDEIIYRCPRCQNLLEVHHDIEALRQKGPFEWVKLFEDRYMRTQWPYG
jgi:threonine synthase